MKNKYKSLHKYIRRVRKWLPCNKAEKNAIVEQIRHMVSGHLDEHPLAGYSDLEKQFGSPEAIAMTYIQEQDIEMILKRMRIRRRIASVVCVTAVTMALVWGFVVGSAWLDYVIEGDGCQIITVIENPDQTEMEGE